MLLFNCKEIKQRAHGEFIASLMFLLNIAPVELCLDCAQSFQGTRVCDRKSEILLWTCNNWIDLIMFPKEILGETSKMKRILNLHSSWVTKEQLLSSIFMFYYSFDADFLTLWGKKQNETSLTSHLLFFSCKKIKWRAHGEISSSRNITCRI